MHVPFDPPITFKKSIPLVLDGNIKMFIHCSIFIKVEKSYILINIWDASQKEGAGPTYIEV